MLDRAYAVALHFMYYNFVRIHGKAHVARHGRCVTDTLWDVSDLMVLIEPPILPQAAWAQ